MLQKSLGQSRTDFGKSGDNPDSGITVAVVAMENRCFGFVHRLGYKDLLPFGIAAHLRRQHKEHLAGLHIGSRGENRNTIQYRRKQHGALNGGLFQRRIVKRIVTFHDDDGIGILPLHLKNFFVKEALLYQVKKVGFRKVFDAEAIGQYQITSPQRDIPHLHVKRLKHLDDRVIFEPGGDDDLERFHFSLPLA